MSDEHTPKECPFCGKQPVQPHMNSAMCVNFDCPLDHMEFMTPKWNRRAPSPQPSESEEQSDLKTQALEVAHYALCHPKSDIQFAIRAVEHALNLDEHQREPPHPATDEAEKWTAGPDGCGTWAIYVGDEKMKGWSGQGKCWIGGLSELTARQIVTAHELTASLARHSAAKEKQLEIVTQQADGAAEMYRAICQQLTESRQRELQALAACESKQTALIEHGRHAPGCDAKSKAGPCDCGLHEAIAIDPDTTALAQHDAAKDAEIAELKERQKWLEAIHGGTLKEHLDEFVKPLLSELATLRAASAKPAEASETGEGEWTARDDGSQGFAIVGSTGAVIYGLRYESVLNICAAHNAAMSALQQRLATAEAALRDSTAMLKVIYKLGVHTKELESIGEQIDRNMEALAALPPTPAKEGQ